MARRELQEINAGSMADIAFLLLIFFLVTTTMDQDVGIMRQLPPISDEPPESETVKERNVYEVLVNANDQLLVEKEPLQISELKDGAMEFLTNSGVFTEEIPDEDLTLRIPVVMADVQQRIAELKGNIQQYPDRKGEWEGDLKTYEAKLDAINFFGNYRELGPSAVISLQNDNGTSYDMYMQVQNELTSAINELRDELTLKYFNKTYLELDDNLDYERRIIKAVRQVYPQRISEAEPKQIGG
ncbi:MAG: biopolymer transporter ExbD [Flavobacteriales bacterium]|nr:biopolymer transporter ExbD [Flavobacteriales bacterium]NNK80166.1 biopolymer transporter ExbD [Flavobacteriales bacterium]